MNKTNDPIDFNLASSVIIVLAMVAAITVVALNHFFMI